MLEFLIILILIPFAAVAAWTIFLAILSPFGDMADGFCSYSTERENKTLAEKIRLERNVKKIEASKTYKKYLSELSGFQRDKVYTEGRRILDKYWFFGRPALEAGLSKFIPAMLESDEAEWQRQQEERRLLRERLRREKQERAALRRAKAKAKAALGRAKAKAKARAEAERERLKKEREQARRDRERDRLKKQRARERLKAKQRSQAQLRMARAALLLPTK